MTNFLDRFQIICIHEDRATHLIAVKLAILSLLKNCPDVSIVVSCPDPPTTFRRWIAEITNVKLVSYPELKNYGWNIKPFLLMRLLENHYSEVIWMDADIIVTKNALDKITRHDANTLVVTQDSYWGPKHGSSPRTKAWGLIPGRNLPVTVNTCILRVTPHHIQLLRAWQIMLRHPIYIQAQGLSWKQRPIHMASDQDVLTALLGSEEFSNYPVVYLKRGVDIAQCKEPSGFTPIERMRNLFSGLPPFVHPIGSKPWTNQAEPPAIIDFQMWPHKSFRKHYEYLALELSPYVSVARRYRKEIAEDTEWMIVKSLFGKIMTILMRGNPLLLDLPLSILSAIVRRIRRFLNIERYADNPKYHLQENPLKFGKSDCNNTSLGGDDR